MTGADRCSLCPRGCLADRAVRPGRCGVGADPVVARASLHYWEEPPISGERGSGTIFFAGCPLGCVYCQNAAISHGTVGVTVTAEDLGRIMLRLAEAGAHNINLVTPTHFVPAILEAVSLAREAGLTLPIVYNTSGYETAETLRMLRGTVDIFLTDFRYLSPELAGKYSGAPDYPDVAKAATDVMLELVGDPVFDAQGMMQKGVIVRQLILPGQTREAMRITDYLWERYGDRIFISLMNQYTPVASIDRELYPELARKISAREYRRVVGHAEDLGIGNAFIQEKGTAEESFIPDFGDRGELDRIR